MGRFNELHHLTASPGHTNTPHHRDKISERVLDMSRQNWSSWVLAKFTRIKDPGLRSA
jgi:hypothetical protein